MDTCYYSEEGAVTAFVINCKVALDARFPPRPVFVILPAKIFVCNQSLGINAVLEVGRDTRRVIHS